MTGNSPLPPSLGARPFSVAEARDAGIGIGRLRGRDLARPHLGVRVPVALPDVGIITRCRSYAPLLRPGQFFSHVTAAEMWGCPLPHDLGTRLHVSVRHPGRAPRADGVIGHQARAPRVLVRHGLPCSDPVSTWIALASLLDLDELVVAGDHLLLDPHRLDPYDIRPHATPEGVAAAANGYRGRGARAVASIFDGAGRFVARADLVFREWRIIVEYDGEQHRLDDAQYERDLVRLEQLRAAGWVVIQVRKRGLFQRPAETVARVVRELRGRGWPGGQGWPG